MMKSTPTQDALPDIMYTVKLPTAFVSALVMFNWLSAVHINFKLLWLKANEGTTRTALSRELLVVLVTNKSGTLRPRAQADEASNVPAKNTCHVVLHVVTTVSATGTNIQQEKRKEKVR